MFGTFHALCGPEYYVSSHLVSSWDIYNSDAFIMANELVPSALMFLKGCQNLDGGRIFTPKAPVSESQPPRKMPALGSVY